MKAGPVANPTEESVDENLHFTHPMKEDVKGKSISPPLREMRVW
jgi:hypothetical protein